jgi:hypothetical protein
VQAGKDWAWDFVGVGSVEKALVADRDQARLAGTDLRWGRNRTPTRGDGKMGKTLDWRRSGRGLNKYWLGSYHLYWKKEEGNKDRGKIPFS